MRTFSFQEHVQEGGPLVHLGQVGVLLIVVKHRYGRVFRIPDHVDHLDGQMQEHTLRKLEIIPHPIMIVMTQSLSTSAGPFHRWL